VVCASSTTTRAASIRQRTRRPVRRQACAKQRFRDIDISETGNDSLIHQEGFQIGFLPPRPCREIIRGHLRPKRLDAKRPKQRMLGSLRMRHHDHESEPARIVVNDARASRERKHDMIVYRIGADTVHIVSRRVRPPLLQNRKAPGHAEMHDEIFATRKRCDQIFGPPLDPDDPLTDQPFGKSLRKRKPQIGAADFDCGDAPSGDNRRQAAPDRFNFGQFGHKGLSCD